MSQSQQALTSNTASSTTLKLPGINSPLEDNGASHLEFTWLNWSERALPITIRERVMLGIMAALKDKPDWEQKVFDPIITEKWKSEAVEGSNLMKQALEDDASEDELEEWLNMNATPRQRVVTQKLFNYCIDELRAQALLSKANGFTEVMDANAIVYISDVAISNDIKTALKAGVATLEAVREEQKDWHPGSEGKVLDLVHPSLFPLMYGRSRYLSRSKVSLKGCAEHICRGTRVPAIADGDDTKKSAFSKYSTKHQWLPCEVKIRDNGDAKITSYINNLHPDGNEGLYSAIERIITKSIPLWKLTLRSTCVLPDTPRMVLQGNGYDQEAADAATQQKREAQRELEAKRKKRREEVDSEDEYIGSSDSLDDSSEESEEEEVYKDKYIQVPEPDAYRPRMRSPPKEKHIGFDERARAFDQSFPGKKLQVIVKLANIHLTPESPSYDGGSWHVEGLRNEHIVASALYYYDSENITDSHLAFRETVNTNFLSCNDLIRGNYRWPSGPWYEQDRYDGIAEIYGLYDDQRNMPATQVLGQVLTREDRLLVFPNVLQHRVSGLNDASKPGHRKLLALFLVDPDTEIPSTAHIPPQQRDWWVQKISTKTQQTRFSNLPTELMDKIYDSVPANAFPMSAESAKRVRKALMKERGAQQRKTNEAYRNHWWGFCEH